MESIAILHQQGYGLLKFGAYVKEGIGGWRHYIFAADLYPNSMNQVVHRSHLRSLPGNPIATGNTPTEIAEDIARQYQNVLCHCFGRDEAYQEWYQNILKSYPGRILTMEDRNNAYMDGVKILSPYSRVE